MKLSALFKISLKYLWRYKRRYLFLFLALGFGFGVLTVISSLKDGIKENLYLSAQSHYAGDITALGYEKDSHTNIHLTRHEQEAIFASAQAVSLDPVSVAVRTTLQGRKEGSIFFNGMAASLKYIVGVDWEAEKTYFDKLSYTEQPLSLDSDSILLSLPIATELGILKGDSIILEVLTTTGQKNTGIFVVGGIIKDSSFFGYYKVFISRLSLNRLIGFADEDCSIIGFSLKDQKNVEQKRKLLYTNLAEKITTGPLVYDRDSFNRETKNLKTGINVFLITLPVHLSELAQLIGAVDLASYVLFGMMLTIIMVSAAVTCSLILHERTKETGTMRAIGFQESDVRLVLYLEIAAMAFFSLAAGFFLALLINRFLSLTSFSWFPGFEVFMQDGRLAPRYLLGTVVVNIMITGCALALAIGGTIFRNSRNPLSEMLSGGAV